VIDENWRRVVGLDNTLNNSRLIVSQSVAKSNVLSNFYNIMKFNGSTESDISSMRFNIYYLLASIRAGRIEEFLAGENISINKEVNSFLNSAKDIKKVGIVAHVKIKGGSWVFVTYARFPYVVLAVLLEKGTNDSYKIKQIEAINYAGVYNHED